LLIWYSQWPVFGYGIYRFILELVIFIGTQRAWRKYGIEESFPQEGESFWDTVFNNSFWDYLKYFGSVFIGTYCEFAAGELGTIMCAAYGDPHVISAYVSFLVWNSINYGIGKGAAISIRTDFGVKLGQKKYRTAKRMVKLGLIFLFVTLIPWFLFSLFGTDYIANIFTQIDSTHEN